MKAMRRMVVLGWVFTVLVGCAASGVGNKPGITAVSDPYATASFNNGVYPLYDNESYWAAREQADFSHAEMSGGFHGGGGRR